MANVRNEYVVTGRYMDGTRVVGYHLIGTNGVSRRYQREEFAFLVGAGKVKDCAGRINDQDVAEEGNNVQFWGTNGLNIQALPQKSVQNPDEVRSVGRVNPNVNPNQCQLVQLICRDDDMKVIVGYVAVTSDGQKAMLKREKVLQMAKNNLIANARLQMANGKPILRSRDPKAKLTDLPRIQVSQANGKAPVNKNVSKPVNKPVSKVERPSTPEDKVADPIAKRV